jgi:hypothetical protein
MPVVTIEMQHRWVQNEKIGELESTFTGDFNIAEDVSGLNGVKDTFQRAFNSWKDDIQYMTNLAIVTNMKCWQHFQAGNETLSEAYSDMYYKVRDWVYSDQSGFTEEDQKYYFKYTD